MNRAPQQTQDFPLPHYSTAHNTPVSEAGDRRAYLSGRDGLGYSLTSYSIVCYTVKYETEEVLQVSFLSCDPFALNRGDAGDEQ
jgi:hypothetical protein